ncbi:MAG UNVERIFIED_CONTAM: hypothetical protein LVR18_27925 [Planctomycetaceae bacterium]
MKLLQSIHRILPLLFVTFCGCAERIDSFDEYLELGVAPRAGRQSAAGDRGLPAGAGTRPRSTGGMVRSGSAA